MNQQKGAALLMAMLTVALVATLASTALWLQWRQLEIETAERSRSQTAWLMTGAFDWTRLILREDAISAQSAGVDHLGEPWALPVQESKLSTFLSQDQQWRDGDAEVFLSGYITDSQSRLNVRNLVEDGHVVVTELVAWQRLFERLNLPLPELQSLTQQLLLTSAGSGRNGSTNRSARAALMPLRTAQLVWLGLSPTTLRALDNFITVLPEPTTVNLNTAPAEVLMACLPDLDMAAARQLVALRARAYWTSVDAARKAFGPAGHSVDDRRHSVSSNYFEINGRMRIDQVVQQERALVKREGNQVRMLWRVRSQSLTNSPPLQ